MEVPILRSLENLFAEGRGDEAPRLLVKCPYALLVRWEDESANLKEGLERLSWWEQCLMHEHPVLFQRIKGSSNRRANAKAVFPSLWRDLLLRSDAYSKVLHLEPGHIPIAQLADEFGMDKTLLFDPATNVIREAADGRFCITVASEALWCALGGSMKVSMIWQIPLQDALLVLLQNSMTGFKELVWVSLKERKWDYSFFALNHNSILENPDDFLAPAFLNGDETVSASFGVPPIVVASTEGRVNAKNAALAIFMRQRDLLIFDEAIRSKPKEAVHWRHLLTCESFEAHEYPVCAACYVLDSFLLYASQDGILRAHPRSNPRSIYHVEDMGTLVNHMVSLYNVVAFVHSSNVLEVRLVCRRQEDPFVSFPRVLYRNALVDCAFAPLLYGPFVIFATLDGEWHRVLYDCERPREVPLCVPHKAGWRIMCVRHADWRKVGLALRNPQTDEIEEIILCT